ncbi:MAG: TrkH family potassium uptake protein [Prolixibacteraceae bacterium]|jgi:trk system potassium uptake protein TrkH|nr:TrkH family potassium uptake protein [Prolixibacteraceae bacterium]
MGTVNIRLIVKVISRDLFIISASLLVCAGVACYFSEEASPFLLPALLAFGLGMIFFLAGTKHAGDVVITQKDAYLTVTLSWFLMALIGCLPYILSGSVPLFTNAFFESVSGFSTTGASILADIEVLPKSIVFWRSFTHWIGGVGIIVLVIIIMPTLQIGGYHLFTLESSLQEKIQPKIKTVGARLLLIYVGLTVAEIVFLLAGGMNLFESVCHAFGTVATGGFSPRNTSISLYSPYIQYVIMVFMLLAGVNFVIHYYLLKMDFKKVKENEELKFYLLVVFLIGSVVTASLYFSMDKPFEEAFRDSFFQVISIITCTGFASADYLQWPVFAWMIIFFCMFLGGSTGSTAGGIKMARHLILIKNIRRFLRQLVSPRAVLQIHLNKKIVNEGTNRSVLSFILVYLLVFLAGTVSLLFFGIDGETASSSVATCMAGIGPGIGTVGPVSNFAHFPDMAKLILSFLMLIGRLEIYPVLMLFSGNFWEK